MQKSKIWFMDNFFNKKYFKWVILVLIILSISFAFYSRFNIGNTEFVGDESAYNKRVAKGISEFREQEGIKNTFKFLNLNDPATMSKTNMSLNLYLFGISFFMNKSPSFFTILNIIISCLLILILYQFLQLHEFSNRVSNNTILIFGLSPVLLFYTMSMSAIPVATLLGLLSLIIIKKKHVFLSVLISILMVLFGTTIMVIYSLVLLFYCIYSNKIRIFYLNLFFLTVTYSALFFLGINLSIPSLLPLNTSNILESLISELGGMRSISIMVFFLFISYFAKRIISKEKIAQTLLLISTGFLMFIYEYRTIFVINILISLYAALMIDDILKRKWEVTDLKKLSILIIVCGIIFTTLSYINIIQDASPNHYETDSLRWLNRQNDGIVLSHPQNSFIIESYNKNPVLVDVHTPLQSETYDDMQIIFNSRDLDVTKLLLYEYNITYIWINKEMRKLLWDEEDDGLQFLFRNEHYFKNIYSDNNNVEIWEFIK